MLTLEVFLEDLEDLDEYRKELALGEDGRKKASPGLDPVFGFQSQPTGEKETNEEID